MKKKMIFWISVMTIFFIIFLMSYLSLREGAGMLNMMHPLVEDKIIMFLSLIGILRALYHIITE